MMSSEGLATIHIIGAGLAGLAAGVKLSASGRRVIVYEMAGHAGGRCRSYRDHSLGQRIDNGNHLLLSGNGEAMTYVAEIGAANTLWQPDRAEFPFVDLETDQRWVLRPGRGVIPFWLFDRTRRVPGASVLQHLMALNLLWAPASATIAERFDRESLFYSRFLEPLAIAVLNTDPQEAAARLLVPVLKQTLGQGESRCRPCIPKSGLSESLIDPAISYIESRGGEFRFGQRARSFARNGDHFSGIAFDDSLVELGPQDAIILTTPPDTVSDLVPELQVPQNFNAIVNGHFVLDQEFQEPAFIGVINASCQWIFVRGNTASVTISAAADLVECGAQDIADRLWPEICRVLELGTRPMSGYKIIKEKRATIAQTPDQELLRPDSGTRWRNLLLAGDWTATGLPATIEGAISSGNKAAAAVLQAP